MSTDGGDVLLLTVGVPVDSGVLGDAVKVTKDKSKITVTTETAFSKRWVQRTEVHESYQACMSVCQAAGACGLRFTLVTVVL